MKNDTFATPEILDVTEIEKCKIQQKGETDRKLIEEQEKTSRERILSKKHRWTDSGFQTAFSLVAITFVISLMSSVMFYTCKRYPDVAAKADCKESISVVRSTDPAVCGVGASLESKVVNDRGDVQVHCVCKK